MVVSNRYEEQLERLNTQLLELKNTLGSLSDSTRLGQNPAICASPSSPTRDTHSSTRRRGNSLNDTSYLGESSFEMHSQRASQAIEKVLESSIASEDQIKVSTLRSLRALFSKSSTQDSTHFNHDLPMPPAHFALKALRAVKMTEGVLFFSACLMDFAGYKEACQRVFFPLNGAWSGDIEPTDQ